MKLYMMKHTDTCWNEKHEKLLPLLSEERQAKVLRYRFDEDKILSLYAGILTRLALIRQLHCSNEQLVFEQLSNHKPCLKSQKSPDTSLIDFSFSHTRHAVLLGITKHGKIGVDIEKVTDAPLKIMETVFHPQEIAYIESAAPSKQGHHFFEIWTRKEAYTKYLGTGLVTDLISINTLASPIKDLLYTWIEEEYICSVCVENRII